jgi:hypothetical protein
MINEHQGFHVITDCDPGDCNKETCICIKTNQDATTKPKERGEAE